MYNARAKLPARFSHSDILKLSEALSGMDGAFSIVRAEHDDNAPWIIEGVLEEKPDPAKLSAELSLAGAAAGIDISVTAEDISIEPVPDINWLAHSYKQFPPFSVGPFFIYGSHYEGDVPPTQLGLQIDAATAFGSGEHGTTKGCLMAMLDLKGLGVCPWNILDMGTGSGILALAAWKLWKTPVLATDNDPECVRVTERHREANKVPAGAADVTSAVGEGFAVPIVQQKKPYELVIANILASVLREMAPELKAVTDVNGYAILSGITQEQAQSVIDIYAAQGMVLKKRYDIGDWATLVLHNPAA